VLATRRQGWRGLVGRANGGMIVHLGVILVAVALAASNSYTHVGEFTVQQGTPITFEGHTFELLDVSAFTTPRSKGLQAEVRIDGGQAYSPKITRYTQMGTDTGTPSVKTGFAYDIYLTLEKVASADATEAQIKIFIKPLILWMWLGGGLMAIGTVLAAFPGKRRRQPTAPVSERVPGPNPEPSKQPETADV
jgi:cytochrome c-type biogenesis protein CcmF